MLFLPKNLASLANVTAKEAGRYSADALRVLDLGGAYRVEATDGRRLAVVCGPCPEAQNPADEDEDAPGGATEALVPAASWREAFRAKGKKDQGVPVITVMTPDED